MVLCFRNIKVVSKEKARFMSLQDKILDLSRIFRNLLLDILPIEISESIIYGEDINIYL
jgi:hypothetical protein